MAWYGVVWYGMVWYGLVWYGMVWYDIVWYGMVRGLASILAWSGHALPRGFNLAGPGSSFLVSGGLPSLFWTLDSFPRATTPGGLDQCPLESPAFCRLPPFPVQWPQESYDLGRSVTGSPASEQTLLGTHSLPRA